MVWQWACVHPAWDASACWKTVPYCIRPVKLRACSSLPSPSGNTRRIHAVNNIRHGEIELSATWDSGIFVNGVGESRKQFFWSSAFTAGPVRFETWNDSLGNLSKTDFGPTYGATLTIDLFRL